MKIIFNIFGKKHTLEIIGLLLNHEKLRFNEIFAFILSSPKTLTARLQDLEIFSILNRTIYKEIPPRVEYSLTEAGRSLEKLFVDISQWIKLWKTDIFNFKHT